MFNGAFRDSGEGKSPAHRGGYADHPGNPRSGGFQVIPPALAIRQITRKSRNGRSRSTGNAQWEFCASLPVDPQSDRHGTGLNSLYLMRWHLPVQAAPLRCHRPSWHQCCAVRHLYVHLVLSFMVSKHRKIHGVQLCVHFALPRRNYTTGTWWKAGKQVRIRVGHTNLGADERSNFPQQRKVTWRHNLGCILKKSESDRPPRLRLPQRCSRSNDFPDMAR